MVDEPAPPLVPDPTGIAPGDRVAIEGEVRQVGEESVHVRFQSGYGLWQYVWIKFHHLFRPDSIR